MNQPPKDYYESNMALLEKNHTALWQNLVAHPPAPLGEVLFAPNGNPNLSIADKHGNSILLHNKAAPESEGIDFLERIPPDHSGFVAILGMGLCYSALNILKERLHLQRLALFELEPGIFIQALRYVDLSSILEDPRLILGIGTKLVISETLAKAFHTLQLETANLYHHLPSFKFNPDGYKQLQEELFTHINGLNVDGATTRTLGKNFLENRFKHLCTIHHHRLLEHLHQEFEGIPAVLVAGGPSLDKNIHMLKQIQENAVIIAVDTALPALLKNEVHPHFMTCIDPNNLTFEKFADVIHKVHNISLICSSWVNPRTPKTFPADQVFWTFTGKQIEAWINSLLGGKLLTGGASTVAHLNLIAAHILGCDPIIFVGQDLAYPEADSASHATGAILQGVSPTGDCIKQIPEETVTGMNGETLRTSRSFLSMKKFFETSIRLSEKRHVNATEGGAHIEGTEILTLQAAIDKYCKPPVHTIHRLKRLNTKAHLINPNKLQTEFENLLKKTHALLKTIKKADDITSLLLNTVMKFKKNHSPVRSFHMLSLQQQKQIHKIDQWHKELDNARDIWGLLEEITMEGLKESERQKQTLSVIQNDPDKYIEWLIKSIHRFLYINQARKDALNLLKDNLNGVIRFYREESRCLKQTSKGLQTDNNTLNLVRLYMDSENYHLAKPLLEELLRVMPESGEIQYYLGCSAIRSNRLTDADQYFQAAVRHHPEYAQKIEIFCRKTADDFLKFGRYFKTQPGREASVRYMLKKGLKHHPGHHDLKIEFEALVKKDLENIKTALDKDLYRGYAPLITEWYQMAVKQKNLFDCISPEMTGAVFLYHGKLLLWQEDYQNALFSFNKAMEYIPGDHEIHSGIIDTLFAMNDFNDAIEALNKAIQVDRKFAAYWETIGDSLKSAGQEEDAIIAYERCFMYLPDNIQLLKKIGDSYLATDQLEAARISYQQLKLKLEAHHQSGQ
jgi:hypothetical protein